ncbi:putative mfs multidrug transporter protein [Botrytis fragariae]|uniref:Putative mfs multidrug transporter protein n=1 Tax=Botrytis fragariae TaxID=1964551 RepID=A0A8H6APN1_9HELO|nr:putative mfs multidrug transporter protein [Botrytis fragariae]KAF5871055.1 putative mfs multidrug transporter protein [Botrytis fragariae]
MALREPPTEAPSHQASDARLSEKMDNDPTLTSSSQDTKLDGELDGNQSPETKELTSVFPAKDESPEPVWAHGLQLWVIMVAVTLVVFLMLLDRTIIVAAFKPKWTFLVFFIIFEIGSLLCGVARSSPMLIGGRVVAGAGASGMFNGSLIIIAESAPMEKRPTLTGIVMGLGQLGLASGPLLGGLFTEFITWRWCFYINLPIGALVVALIGFVRIPQQHPRPLPMSVFRSLHTHLDLLGFSIFSSALIMLLLACQYGGTIYPWNNSRIVGLFVGSGVTFIVFLAWNYYKGDEALIPISIACMKTVWTSCIVYGLMMSNLYLASYWVPEYFQGVKGVSPTKSGIYLLAMIIAHVFAALASGPIVGIVGYTIPIALFSSVLLSVGCGLFGTFTPHTSVGKWLGYQILYGVGRGLGIQMPILSVQKTVPPKTIPLAMALVTFSQSFGAALFLSLGETIYSNSFQTLIPQYAPGVNATKVIDAGATAFRGFLSGDELEGVLNADAKSIDCIFYMAAGLAAGCFVFAWGMGWKDLRAKMHVSKV